MRAGAIKRPRPRLCRGARRQSRPSSTPTSTVSAAPGVIATIRPMTISSRRLPAWPILQARLNGGEPAYLATVVADKVAGLSAAYAIARGAVRSRKRRRRAGNRSADVRDSGEFRLRRTSVRIALTTRRSARPNIRAWSRPNAGPIARATAISAVMIYTDRHWRAFFDAIGNPDWSTDPMFASHFRPHAQYRHGARAACPTSLRNGPTMNGWRC